MSTQTQDKQRVAQDLTRKIVIVLVKGLEPWVAMNAVAHIAAYLGNKMKEPFATGSNFVTKDGKNHPRNSQFPIILLSAKPGQMKKLMEDVRESGLLYLGFIREMIETSDDDLISITLIQKLDEDVEYLGIGIFGKKEEADALTKKLSLWR